MYDAKAWGRKYYQDNKKKVWLQRLRNPAVWMCNNAKQLAKKTGLEYSIKGGIEIPDKCPILDIELKASLETPTRHSPTLFRIDLDKGFVSGNCVVVSRRAALIRKNFTLEQMIEGFSDANLVGGWRRRGVLEDHIKLVDWLKNASSLSELETND